MNCTSDAEPGHPADRRWHWGHVLPLTLALSLIAYLVNERLGALPVRTLQQWSPEHWIPQHWAVPNLPRWSSLGRSLDWSLPHRVPSAWPLPDWMLPPTRR